MIPETAGETAGDERAVVALYATFPDLGTAERVGTALVERGLVACVNLIPGMRSIYRWRGAVERADEIVMIGKTRKALARDAITAIEAAHPYDTPAIVVLPLDEGSRRYLDWIIAETGGSAGSV